VITYDESVYTNSRRYGIIWVLYDDIIMSLNMFNKGHVVFITVSLVSVDIMS